MANPSQPPPATRSIAARLFGYDVFISFALTGAERSTRNYAADLARRLRELDFTVFFSEEEAPAGDRLAEPLLSKGRLAHRQILGMRSTASAERSPVDKCRPIP
jgi:hypothetical protein